MRGLKITQLLSVVLLSMGLGLALLPAQETESDFVAVLTIDGAIGPASSDYLQRGFQRAANEGASAVVLKLDTPGGLVTSTRDITKAMLASPVPIIGWVAPDGARAASAGTFIIYASHLAAMAPATSMGAATPVQMGGGMPGDGEDDREREDDDPANGDGSSEATDSDEGEGEQADDQASNTPAPRDRSAEAATAGERKAINDSVAYIKSLAERHGRNAEWAERAVRDAATVTASEALEIGAIELIASNLEQLLADADGRVVNMEDGELTLATAGLPTREYTPDWRTEFLSVITSPQIAYFLLIIGLYGLLLEGYNPGALVPGVVGGISLLVALYALQMLPVNYAGLLLIILGLSLIVAELFAPSFGILGLGGLASLTFGFIILLDSDIPGMEIPTGFIVGLVLVSAASFFITAYLLRKALRLRRVDSARANEGRLALALEDFEGRGNVRLDGEIWQAFSEQPVSKDQNVRVVEQDGLRLLVTPVEDSNFSQANTES